MILMPKEKPPEGGKGGESDCNAAKERPHLLLKKAN